MLGISRFNCNEFQFLGRKNKKRKCIYMLILLRDTHNSVWTGPRKREKKKQKKTYLAPPPKKKISPVPVCSPKPSSSSASSFWTQIRKSEKLLNLEFLASVLLKSQVLENKGDLTSRAFPELRPLSTVWTLSCLRSGLFVDRPCTSQQYWW